ncbi:MAG TPA: apolipoprotein N-acyltransferase [Polyangia bacterium]
MKLRLLKAGVALASGVLLFLACADFDIWPLAWVAVAPLLWVILDERTEKPAVYGLLCGLTANGGGFYWIVGFLERFGHLPLIAALPIFLLLIGYQAITFALFAWLLRRLHDRLGDRYGLGVIFLAPIVYVAVELVVPYVFPWYLAITQAWVRPVIQIADLTGPLGVSFLLVLCNAALYAAVIAWRKKQPLPLRRLIVALSVIAASLIYGQVRIHQVEASRNAAPKIKVGVVQANIGISEKWQPDLAAQQLATHQEVSARLEHEGAQLILWPESSYPYMFRRDQAHDWLDYRRVQRGFHTPLIFGSLTAGGGARYPYNSALILDAESNVRGIFDKNILMVFGEYIPYYDEIGKWIKEYIPETSNWARGTDVTVFPFAMSDGATAEIGPMICYEDIFPSFGRRLARRHPNLLVNITNDAWFGRTSEPYEHLALSVYRAVEMRLDLVRAVNTGVSAFVDSTGRVYDHSPSVDPDETPGVQPVGLLAPAAIQKPFTLYASLGEWFGALCLILLLLLGERALERAGRPVRWRSVGIGAAALLVSALAVSAIVSGPSRLGLAISLLLHRTLPPGSEAVAFRTGLGLVPALIVGCALAGWLTARRARPALTPARLEIALSVIAVMVAPAMIFGTLEGEQAGLVLGAMAGVGVALLSARLLARRRAESG